MKGWCEKCQQLVDITPTGEPIPKQPNNRYWRLVLHKVKDAPAICEASGDKV